MKDGKISLILLFLNIITSGVGPSSKNPLAFKWYNAEEMILGKTMKVCSILAYIPWGRRRPIWCTNQILALGDGTNSLAMAKRGMRANFEFLEKLGVDRWCFHDRDIAPEGKTLEYKWNLDCIIIELLGFFFSVLRRRESIDVEDLFIAHIAGMDTLACGPRNAANLIEDGSLAALVHKRYESFDTEIGAQI
ncbi:hypothetical protein GH714_042269 [Hevea brasiliensis]|uniref:xylose isomerase n=1 Tax=Hevea brasiliensis TaxID=3981 RepID=A0A6A6KTF2_HEVBR|nr:hypothetical protein GH714_042269 [Hevea brasiliensis]